MPAPPRRLAVLVLLAALAAATAPATAAGAARVVGAAEARPETWHSQLQPVVSVIRLDATDQYNGQFCAGTLIDERHVLTAAHCVVHDGPVRFRLAPSSIAVGAGSPVLDRWSLRRDRLTRISAIFVHPSFNLATLRWDAAVLRLARPVTTVPTMPVLTPLEAARVGLGASELVGTVAGWGDTDPVDPQCCYPWALHEARIPLPTDDACRANLAYSPTWRFASEHQLCAGRLGSYEAPGSDTCDGDSGGPLLLEVDGATRLAGITSHGAGCAQEHYGVYSRASSLTDWLAAIPGIPAGDSRNPAHGPDDLGAPRVVGEPLDYRRVRLRIAPPLTGARGREHTVWVRVGRPLTAVDIYSGRSAASQVVVAVPPVNSRARYRFLVRALGVHGEGPATLISAAPRPDLRRPTTPGAVRASRVAGWLEVRWRAARDAETGVDGYWVQRGTSGRRWARPQYVEAPGTMAAFRTGSAAGQVRVRARDAAGNGGAWSRPVPF